MKRNLLLATALLALAASCSQDDGRSASGANERAPLRVSSVTTLSGESNTRAVGVPVPVLSGGLTVGLRATNEYTAATYNYTTSGGGVWTIAAGTQSAQLSNKPASLWAYHPTEGFALSHNLVTLLQQAYSEEKAFSYAISGGANVCALYPDAGFVLKHQYARVQINIAFSPLFSDQVILNEVSLVAGDGFKDFAELEVESGTLSISNSASPGIIRKPENTMGNLQRRYTVDELMIPCPDGGLRGYNPLLTVTLDGSNWKAYIPALTTLEAGKMYRIKVKMGADVVIESVTVEEWVDGGEFDGGDTTYE